MTFLTSPNYRDGEEISGSQGMGMEMLGLGVGALVTEQLCILPVLVVT